MNDALSRKSTSLPLSTKWVVWLAFAMSLPLFAAVTFMVQQSERSPGMEIMPQGVAMGIAIALFIGSVLVSRLESLPSLTKMVIGLALAEGVAIAGLLHAVSASTYQSVLPFLAFAFGGYLFHLPAKDSAR